MPLYIHHQSHRLVVGVHLGYLYNLFLFIIKIYYLSFAILFYSKYILGL